jgi:hypothetical protein
MREPPSGTIETVDGVLAPADAEAVASLLEESGAVAPGEAGSRLPEVLCLLRDADGALVGVNWAFPDDVALLAGRRFWMYQSVLAQGFEDAAPAMISHAFAALERGFDPDARGPIGVCVVLRDRAEMRRRPDAVWSDPHMIYVGYQADGGQVRVGYFADATV